MIFPRKGRRNVNLAEPLFKIAVVQGLDPLDVVPQLGNDWFGQDGTAPLVPLAEHMNPLAVKIKVLDSQADTFHKAQAGPEHEFGHQGVGAFDVPEKEYDFRFAEHSGQKRLSFGTNRLNFAFKRGIEHLAVQKNEGIQGLALGRGGYPLPARQIGKKTFDIPGAAIPGGGSCAEKISDLRL